MLLMRNAPDVRQNSDNYASNIIRVPHAKDNGKSGNVQNKFKKIEPLFSLIHLFTLFYLEKTIFPSLTSA